MRNKKIFDLEKQLGNLNLEVVYNEGIKERIESFVDNDIYHKYGVLIAKGKVDFDLNALRDITSLVKIVSRYSKETERKLDW
jgi:hypothetical protein